MEPTDARPYPAAALDSLKEDDWLQNPAFRFFGKRLYTDQTLPEFLNEFLLVLFSPKRTADTKIAIEGCLPPLDLLHQPGGQCLEYAPATRLNLKLFAFFGSSRLDARHPAHLEHFEHLRSLLFQHMQAESDKDKAASLQDLENLFLGLRSCGEGRTWCAQQFLPLCPNLQTAETLWNEKEALRASVESWEESFTSVSKFWSINKHRFMARGGEVLFYQLCLALGQDKETIAQWNETAHLGLGSEELDPALLLTQLEEAFPCLLKTCQGLDALASVICNLEKDTANKADTDRNGELRYQSMGWCSADSWQEGYLFAVELLRILRADIDIMDRLALLETACGLQILRTLSARTAARSEQGLPSWPGYLIPITAQNEKNATLRSVSQHAFKRMHSMQERLILAQVHNCSYKPKNKGDGSKEAEEAAIKKYLGEEVGKHYAAGLFTLLAKNSLGMVVPRTGGGERFVLSERILRLLVLTLVPATKHLSLDTFKQRVRAWHGFVFDAEGFEKTQHWLTGQTALFPARCDTWLRNMLEDGNFLRHLSDACSLVHNPIAERQER